MARHFPHWLLALGRGGDLLLCPHCGELLIFASGAVRCVACATPATPAPADHLVWTGHLPALVRPAPALERRLPALAAAGYPTISAGDGRYLLVPLTVSYPDQWPHTEPAVRYPARFLQLIGAPAGPSGAYHLFDAGRACLFAGGQWRGVTVRVVLQQRMVNHLASLLKIAAGAPPAEAFIGRIH